MNNFLKIANWLLMRVIRYELQEELLGDLHETYVERVARSGNTYAIFMYWFDVIHLIVGFASRPNFKSQNRIIMLNHYITIAARNIVRNKIYSAINILSLAIGMGVCLIISQYIFFELSYDRFHDSYQNIYRVIVEDSNSDIKETYPDGLGYSFGVLAKQNIPEVKEFVRKERVNRVAAVTNPQNNTVFHEGVNELFFVDPSFFEIFNFKLLYGELNALFTDKFSIVISQATALKYFGIEDPIGKQLEISGSPSPGSYTVTGVVKTPPVNSHLQFDMLMPISNYIAHGWGGAVKKQGGWGFSMVTYLTLDEHADIQTVQHKLNELITDHTASNSEYNDIRKKVILQPIADVYLKSSQYTYPGFIDATGNVKHIIIFSIIAFIILLTAWINFINLSNSQALQRAKEVGVRKSLGAIKKQLMSQFLLESILINVLAAGLAIFLAMSLLPILNQIIGKELNLNLFHQPLFWIIFLATILTGALAAGFYPSIILAGFNPIRILKGNKSRGKKYVNTRKGLIIFQFATSLLLISGTYLIYRQVNFLQERDLGVALEKMMIIQGPLIVEDKASGLTSYQTFRNELSTHHAVEAVAGSWKIPGQYAVLPYRLPSTPFSEAPHIRGFYASLGFEKTYSLEFVAGKPFTASMQEEEVAIINESAVKSFGFASTEKAIGQKLMRNNTPVNIVGVVKDFHWHTLHEGHLPYLIDLKELRLHEYISVKLNTTNIKATIKNIEATYLKFFPGNPFEYYFADQTFNAKYQSDHHFNAIFLCFAILAIIISCVGLFALVSQSLTTRIKEIGVRKVLGAKSDHLVLLLTKEYLIMIVIATLIALPAGIYIANAWLNNYAYRINLGLDLIVIPVSILILLTLLTISNKTIATINLNPVDTLKSE